MIGQVGNHFHDVRGFARNDFDGVVVTDDITRHVYYVVGANLLSGDGAQRVVNLSGCAAFGNVDATRCTTGGEGVVSSDGDTVHGHQLSLIVGIVGHDVGQSGHHGLHRSTGHTLSGGKTIHGFHLCQTIIKLVGAIHTVGDHIAFGVGVGHSAVNVKGTGIVLHKGVVLVGVLADDSDRTRDLVNVIAGGCLESGDIGHLNRDADGIGGNSLVAGFRTQHGDSLDGGGCIHRDGSGVFGRSGSRRRTVDRIIDGGTGRTLNGHRLRSIIGAGSDCESRSGKGNGSLSTQFVQFTARL